ncbi:MAG TPA: hypothetical protein VLN49_11620 [Gemmatimonadaceae bacterium]|nr:hypothetical protein [Gemmatimonadaceae bacterium]
MSFLRRHWLGTLLGIVIVLPILIVSLWATIALHYTYSTGYRAGYLQKFSKRGWLCKTWEGELQITAIPGSTPEIFLFSTRSDSIAAVLSQLSGKRVAVEYEQHKGVPTSCFGDTEYFAIAVRPVDGP